MIEEDESDRKREQRKPKTHIHLLVATSKPEVVANDKRHNKIATGYN